MVHYEALVDTLDTQTRRVCMELVENMRFTKMAFGGKIVKINDNFIDLVVVVL